MMIITIMIINAYYIISNILDRLIEILKKNYKQHTIAVRNILTSVKISVQLIGAFIVSNASEYYGTTSVDIITYVCIVIIIGITFSIANILDEKIVVKKKQNN